MFKVGDKVRCKRVAAAGPHALAADPKQVHGVSKPPIGLVPTVALAHEAMAYKLGADKYGPFNWRPAPGTEARPTHSAMTYLHAALRHIHKVIDREDYDPEAAAHHLGCARASLGIYLDAEATGTLLDDRPPKGKGSEVLEALKREVKP